MNNSQSKSRFSTCSASTTASNSGKPDFLPKNDINPICDWLSFRHVFNPSKPTKAIESGRTLKITRDGVITYENLDFEQIVHASSDTSVRIKCDGKRLYFSGNIGRFGEQNNLEGHTVLQSFEKAHATIHEMYPEIDVSDLGLILHPNTIYEYGTTLTRLDLAANFKTDNFAGLCNVYSSRKINRRYPQVGKYGVMWGYDSKRGQYWKAKLYDKLAELEGKKTPNILETIARFEIQLGSQFLHQNKLKFLRDWINPMTTNIIYAKFFDQLTREPLTGDGFADLPPRLRQHAVLWRDGTNPRTYLSKTQFYDVRKKLLEHGLDISVPCNVTNLTQHVKFIELQALDNYRKVSGF